MEPINHGMPVVYSNSLIPGYFQSLFASVPMFISTSPFSMIVYIQFLNLIFCVFLYFWITFLFKQFKNIYVFAFIVFSPWNIYGSQAWNAALMPFFSLFIVLGLTLVFSKKYVNFGVFLCLSIPLLALQINLQFMTLIVLLIFLYVFGFMPKPKFLLVFWSLIPSAITLYPFVLMKLNLMKYDEPTWGYLNVVTQNLKLNLNNILEINYLFYRLMTFSTAELLSRFEDGYLRNNYYIWPFVFFGMTISIIIVIINLSFYFSKARWKLFFNSFNFKNKDYLTIIEKFDIICLIIPFIVVFLSLFSITRIPKHGLLCVFFVSYYILFRRLYELKYSFIFDFKKSIVFYIVVTSMYTFFAGSSYRLLYSMVVKIAPIYCDNKDISNAIEKAGYKKDKLLSKENYEVTETAISQICPYYNSLKNGNL
jgi:hypothetical protein